MNFQRRDEAEEEEAEEEEGAEEEGAEEEEAVEEAEELRRRGKQRWLSPRISSRELSGRNEYLVRW